MSEFELLTADQNNAMWVIKIIYREYGLHRCIHMIAKTKSTLTMCCLVAVQLCHFYAGDIDWDED